MSRERWLRSARRLAGWLPITARGALVAGFSGLALWLWGYGALDLVALTLGLSGIALVLLCAAGSGLLAWWVRRRARSAPAAEQATRIEAETPIASGFALALPRLLPLVALRWDWSEPPGVDCRVERSPGRARERIVAHARNEVTRVTRRFTAHDVFGLSRVSWESGRPASLSILPAVGRLRRIEVLHSLAGGDDRPHPDGAPEGDRMEIRRYVPGDPVRHVMWKIYARTRLLNVRTPERSLADARRTLVYLVAAPDDEAAAAAARVALESGACGPEWIFGADGSDADERALEPALLAIARSGSARGRGAVPGQGLTRFLRRHAQGGVTRCVIFAPARSGGWLEPVLRAAAIAGNAHFVLGASSLARPLAAPPLWRRALYAAAPGTAVPTDELQRLLQRIVAAGHAALVVDRALGRCFGAGRSRAERLSA